MPIRMRTDLERRSILYRSVQVCPFTILDFHRLDLTD